MDVNLDLGLDLSLSYVPKSMSELFMHVSQTSNNTQKLSILQHYLKTMELELNKIHSFKRELPFSILLLNDGMRKLKEIMECSNPRKELENEQGDFGTGQRLVHEGKSNEEEYSSSSNYENSVQVMKRAKPVMAFNGNSDYPGLSVVSPYSKYDFYYSKISSTQFQYVPQPPPQQPPAPVQSQQRPQFRRWKCRRRWSPTLHQIFEDVLQRLGGAAGAKPKQVKELMNVEGLTCDEVKSHLQKYRLGLQRPPNSQPAQRGRPRQMNIRKHFTVTNQTDTNTCQNQNLRKSSSTAHEHTSTSVPDSLEAVDENTTNCQNWRSGFILIN